MVLFLHPLKVYFFSLYLQGKYGQVRTQPTRYFNYAGLGFILFFFIIHLLSKFIYIKYYYLYSFEKIIQVRSNSGLEISENSRGSGRTPLIFWGGPQQKIENSEGPANTSLHILLKHFNGITNSLILKLDQYWWQGNPHS